MPKVKVRQVVDAPLGDVWSVLADIPGHVEWMADATSIQLLTEQRQGVGTAFDCLTEVGPFRTYDRMVVTEWEERRVIGVRHTGLVTGEGRFTLRRSVRAPASRTVVTWREHLRFPWYLGGPVGGAVARPVLRRVWRNNLRRLNRRFAPAPD